MSKSYGAQDDIDVAYDVATYERLIEQIEQRMEERDSNAESLKFPVAQEGDTVTLPADTTKAPLFIDKDTGALLTPELDNPNNA